MKPESPLSKSIFSPRVISIETRSGACSDSKKSTSSMAVDPPQKTQKKRKVLTDKRSYKFRDINE